MLGAFIAEFAWWFLELFLSLFASCFYLTPSQVTSYLMRKTSTSKSKSPFSYHSATYPSSPTTMVSRKDNEATENHFPCTILKPSWPIDSLGGKRKETTSPNFPPGASLHLLCYPPFWQLPDYAPVDYWLGSLESSLIERSHSIPTHQVKAKSIIAKGFSIFIIKGIHQVFNSPRVFWLLQSVLSPLNYRSVFQLGFLTVFGHF